MRLSQRHAPAALYPLERPGTHCTEGWVGPRAGLDRCGKSRPPPTGIRSPDRPASRYIPLRYPAHINPCTLHLFMVFVKSLLVVVSCFLFDSTKGINLLVSSSAARRNRSYLASTRTKTRSDMSRTRRKSRAIDVSSENV